MNNLEIFVLLMSIAIILVGFASKLHISYPIALTIGGSALGFFPGLEGFNFDPAFVLVIVLPPTLYYAAYSIPFKEFKKNINDILWLALGLVIVTTFCIGVLFKWLFPELPWAIAFIFGAIVSPPDAIAATTILKRFAISSRLLTVLEGESLINDATGLVLYKIGVVALLTGVFSFQDASIEFFKVTIGGMLIGVLCGYIFHQFSSRFFDPILAVVYSFTIPYLTYFIADRLEVSGVLAVVICGLIGARMFVTSYFSSLTRVIGWASWDIMIILLNCFVFILIGLQLHGLIQRLTVERSLLYLFYGFIFTTAILFVRIIWVYLNKIFNEMMNKNPKMDLQNPNDAIIVSWSGMRGIVSLTAALALPYTMGNGTLLPGRDIVIFLTFIVILLTLLIPGLTLPYLISWLNIKQSNGHEDSTIIRTELIKTAHTEIHLLHERKMLDKNEYSFLLNYFYTRHQMLDLTAKSKKSFVALEEARLKILGKKRERLLELWENNEISDELFNTLERELDLEEAYQIRAEI